MGQNHPESEVIISIYELIRIAKNSFYPIAPMPSLWRLQLKNTFLWQNCEKFLNQLKWIIESNS